jgi:hypothetical protein
MSKRAIVAACLGCLIVGYLAASVPGFNPVNPFRPQPDRPVVRFLQRLARMGLWLTVFAEPGPRPVEQQYSALHLDDKSLICHAEGW